MPFFHKKYGTLKRPVPKEEEKQPETTNLTKKCFQTAARTDTERFHPGRCSEGEPDLTNKIACKLNSANLSTAPDN